MKRKQFQRKPCTPLEPVTRKDCTDETPDRAAPSPKTADFVCPEYLAFVRMLPCYYAKSHKCVGQIIAHHIKRKGGNQDDRTAVAICWGGHGELHAGNLPDVDISEAMKVEALFHEQGSPEQKTAFKCALEKMQAQRIWK